jgi:hypothetical protein
MVCNSGSRCSVWGHFWGTIGQNPSIPKPNRLHIVNKYEFEVYSLESIRGIGHFSESWTWTGYFANSTVSSGTSSWFSLFIVEMVSKFEGVAAALWFSELVWITYVKNENSFSCSSPGGSWQERVREPWSGNVGSSEDRSGWTPGQRPKPGPRPRAPPKLSRTGHGGNPCCGALLEAADSGAAAPLL